MSTNERLSCDLLCLPQRDPLYPPGLRLCVRSRNVAIGVLGESSFCTDIVRDLKSAYRWVRVAMCRTPRGVEQRKASGADTELGQSLRGKCMTGGLEKRSTISRERAHNRRCVYVSNCLYHQSPVTTFTHQSSLSHTTLTHYSPLITNHSSLTTHHSSLITRHSSRTTHHSSLSPPTAACFSPAFGHVANYTGQPDSFWTTS